MKPGIKLVSVLAVAAFCSGAAIAAVKDDRMPASSAAVWIGPSLDRDRAVNASPDAQAIVPVRSADPAKAQMAASTGAAPVVAIPPMAGEDAIASAPAETRIALATDADRPIAAETDVQISQLSLPRPPVPAVRPVPTPGQPTRPALDTTTPTPPAMSATTAPPPADAANVLAGGAIFTSTSGRDLNIEINRGALVRLNAPADTVFIANPEIADIQVKSPRMIYVYGKKAGETVLYAVDSDDNILMNARVAVTHNLAAFRTALRSTAPNSDVKVKTVGDALVISGDIASAAQAEDIRRLAARFAPGEGAVVNQMRITAPNQINLRVRIAEVSRENLKQFGINWDAAMLAGGFAFGLFTGAPVIAEEFVIGGLNNIVNSRTNNTNSLYGGYRDGKFDVNGLIDALANENLISVLAEPNLTAMSGETANFLAGGEFPIPVAQSGSANGAITVEFKKFGVGLAFTPTVIDGNRINLRVRPEVSQLSSVGQVLSQGIAIPALTTRQAETTVELASGQSFAIAGLLQNDSTQDVSKVPFLGDVPILGALFKSDRYRRNETELVIVVTPYLVRPVSANAVAVPNDGLVPPTDGQRILYGSTNKQQVPAGARVTRGADGNALIGPAGFQLD